MMLKLAIEAEEIQMLVSATIQAIKMVLWVSLWMK